MEKARPDVVVVVPDDQVGMLRLPLALYGGSVVIGLIVLIVFAFRRGKRSGTKI